MEVIDGLLAVLLALLAWAVFVHASPYKSCPWCKHRKPGRSCWRCGGHRELPRLGSVYVRRAKVAARNQIREWWENR